MEEVEKKFNPLVSIVIPVYNGSNYMREAIDSALDQTYKNIEIIVVNDGSKDNTEKIAKSYRNKIRYFSKENGGAASALNLAIQNAKGEYISWLSHDDVYYLEKIEKQINRLEKLKEDRRDSTILISNYCLINEKTEITSILNFHKTHPLEKLNYPLYPLLNGLVHGCSLLIPKKCFEEIGYFNPQLKTTQDYDLWFRMFPKYEVDFMVDVLVKSRWHAEQATKTIKTVIQEADQLWIRMVNGLSDEQKIRLNGGVLSFYENTHAIMKAAGYVSAEKYLLELIDKFKQRDIEKIKVSVIIPFYNRIEWTIEAIKSVISQTHKNLEIILINDLSSDSIDLIKNIAKNDKRIKLVDNKRKKGVSGARNTGIDFATGEYIAFLDSDDLFFPEKIKKQLEFMVREGFLFSHTSYSLFSNNFMKESIINSGKADITYPTIIVNCFATTPTIMIHSDIFKNSANRFIEHYSIGEDTCLWIKISRISPSKGLDIVLTKVRKHGNNAAYDNSKQIQGLGNILDYLMENYLNDETFVHVNNLNNAFIKIGGIDKKVFEYKLLKEFKCDNLQISDNDLIGNKFNGHDLHFYLREKNIDSKQLVWNKESKDDNTFLIARDKSDRLEIYERAQSIQNKYSLNGVLNPIGYDILQDPLFINAGIVHLHLINNYIFDIQLLPLITRLKPVVWTLHDPWSLGGHCIHHFECEKWKTHCQDCSNLRVPFGLQLDNSALNYALKKDAITNSKFEVIVASRWMEKKVIQSPIFKGKSVHVIPFGINQEIFKPINKAKARETLKIPENALVILIRCDYSGFKGMDFIEYILKRIRSDKKIVVLILKEKLRGEFKELDLREFGWIKDDNFLAKIYSASDLFLMPSAVESFGMMAIESMSCGTLPIVLEGTSLPEVINAPECGVAVKRDKKEYLKTVQYYIENENERTKKSNRCLGFARKNYSKNVFVKKIIDVYGNAKANYRVSRESELLLSQLRKNVNLKSNSNSTQVIKIKKTRGILLIIKGYLILFFWRHKNILPNILRSVLRKILMKININIETEVTIIRTSGGRSLKEDMARLITYYLSLLFKKK